MCPPNQVYSVSVMGCVSSTSNTTASPQSSSTQSSSSQSSSSVSNITQVSGSLAQCPPTKPFWNAVNLACE